MAKTRGYILQTFGKSFLLVFLPFLLIVSLVFLIQLSILSSKIHLNMQELVHLFGLFLPEILFYTLPFSLIAALANTFGRLSEENELIALFALGHRPSRILAYLLPTLLLFCALLLVLSLMLYPQMKQKINAFKEYKITEATLNISPNKLSQSFGDYHVFVAAKEKGEYKDVVLFDNHDPKREQIFLAKRADASNTRGRIRLTLYDGSAETSDAKTIQTLHYKSLSIYRYPQASSRRVQSDREYWAQASTDKHRRGKMLYFIFVSLSPVLTFPLIALLSIFNPRYQKNRSAVVIFIAAMSIYLPAALVQKSGSLALFFLFLFLIAVLGAWLMKIRLMRRY